MPLGGPLAHPSLDTSFPGLESPGLWGCSCCKSHSTPLKILVIRLWMERVPQGPWLGWTVLPPLLLLGGSWPQEQVPSLQNWLSWGWGESSRREVCERNPSPWDHWPLLHKFNTWWHSNGLFFPQHIGPVRWTSPFSCWPDSPLWALLLQTARPYCHAAPRACSWFSGFALHHSAQHFSNTAAFQTPPDPSNSYTFLLFFWAY